MSNVVFCVFSPHHSSPLRPVFIPLTEQYDQNITVVLVPSDFTFSGGVL